MGPCAKKKKNSYETPIQKYLRQTEWQKERNKALGIK